MGRNPLNDSLWKLMLLNGVPLRAKYPDQKMRSRESKLENESRSTKYDVENYK